MYYVVCNPASKSGKGRKIWKKAKAILKREGEEYRIYHTSRTRNATVVAAAVLEKDTSDEIKLMVLGGDGTVNEVLQAFREKDYDRVCLYYLPTGSSNDLARDLGYSSSVEENLMHILKSGAYRMMDIGQVTYNASETLGYTKRYFAVSCGMGFDASVCHEALNSESKNVLNKFGLGKLSYGKIAINQLLGIEKAHITVTDDEGITSEYENAYFAAVMNHRYQGGGFMFCPEASDSDGKLDICIANNISKMRVLYTLPYCMKGKHVGMKGISIGRSAEYRIISDIPLYVHTDGEVKTKATDITVKCMAARIKFAV